MRRHDLIVIGTGSGNSIVDARFDHLDVAIVEEGTFGGTCLNVGCVPTKMFVVAADVASTVRGSARYGIDATLDAVRWTDIRDRIFERIDPIAVDGERYRREAPNVTVYAERARFVGPKRLRLARGLEVEAEHIVIAAGSRPVLPDVAGLAGPRVHTSDTIMRIDNLPSRLAILGGGVIAAEMAHVFSSLGVEVTVIARSEGLLIHEDTTVSTRFTALARDRWDVRTDTWVIGAEDRESGMRLSLCETGGCIERSTVEADLVLVAIGRVPNSDRLEVTASDVTTYDDGRVVVDDQQQTSVEGIWALGDVTSPHQLKHVANHEARVVRHNLLHPDSPMRADHRFVPRAVFSSPQIAAVGRSERDLAEAEMAYVVGLAEYRDVAYGWALEDTTGFVKLLADPQTGLLLGAHIVGPQASTLVQPLVQAMSTGLPVRDMARGQYWIHPALPEVIENALLDLL